MDFARREIGLPDDEEKGQRPQMSRHGKEDPRGELLISRTRLAVRSYYKRGF